MLDIYNNDNDIYHCIMATKTKDPFTSWSLYSEQDVHLSSSTFYSYGETVHLKPIKSVLRLESSRHTVSSYVHNIHYMSHINLSQGTTNIRICEF